MQLNGQQLWQRYQDYLISNTSLGFELDVSRVQFKHDFLDKMAPAMAEAYKAMDELERGSIANVDEQRMVGHYWLRAPELVPTEHAEIAAQIRDTNAKLIKFAQAVHSGEITGSEGPFENMLHIGIGGSALGPQFLADALGTCQDKLKMYFFDNTDPNGMDRVLQQIGSGLGRTLVSIASKSGGTPETRNGMIEVQRVFQERGLNFSRQAVAITQEGSALDKLAASENWAARFAIWDWVGGRTSITSAVGLLPAALQGIDIQSLLDGAAEMDRLTRVADTRRNPAAMLAMMWFDCTSGRGNRDMVILPYKDRLALFSRYLQQLVMESLGKEYSRSNRLVRQGITVYGNKGSTDQHAYVQQLREGVPNFFVTFIQVLKDRLVPSSFVEPDVTSGDYLHGFWQGTRQALYDNDIDLMSITLEDVTPRSVGALIALYERAVGLYAELINVNAYHQPGVEAGKKAAKAVLELQLLLLKQVQSAKTPQTAFELASAVGKSDDVETAYHLLKHMSANPDHGIHCWPGNTAATDRFALEAPHSK
jgi:glucose-6-phosphate isomerase